MEITGSGFNFGTCARGGQFRKLLLLRHAETSPHQGCLAAFAPFSPSGSDNVWIIDRVMQHKLGQTASRALLPQPNLDLTGKGGCRMVSQQKELGWEFRLGYSPDPSRILPKSREGKCPCT